MTEPVALHYRYRSRSAGLRVLTAALLALLVVAGTLMFGLLVHLGRPAVFLHGNGLMGFIYRVILIMPLLLAVIVGGSLHAHLGANKTTGPLPAPLDLWRRKELRALPPLPPLARWKLALVYAIPLTAALLAITVLYRQQVAVDASLNDSLQQSNLTQMLYTMPLGQKMTRVSCLDFPVPELTPRSACFVLTSQRPASAFVLSAFLSGWVQRMQSWVEWDNGFQPTQHQAPPQTLDTADGGGYSGFSEILPLRVSRGLPVEDVSIPHQITALTRLGPTDGPVPAEFAGQAAWLKGQPFHTFLTVTPLR